MVNFNIVISFDLYLWQLSCLASEAFHFTKLSNIYVRIGSYRSVGQLIRSASIKSETECARICTHYVSCMSYTVQQGSSRLNCDVYSDVDVDNLAVDLTRSYYGNVHMYITYDRMKYLHIDSIVSK